MTKYAEATAIGVVLAAMWLALLGVLMRGVVPFLWGSRSDFGMIGAVIVGAIGIAALLYLGAGMVRVVSTHLDGEDEK